MKKQKRNNKPSIASMELKEAAVPFGIQPSSVKMLRTQIYLNQTEYDFLRREALRQEAPMAAIIRQCVDERMNLSEKNWSHNPLLEPAVEDPSYISREDGVKNHDHYLYGCPKKYRKVNGKWEWIPLPK